MCIRDRAYPLDDQEAQPGVAHQADDRWQAHVDVEAVEGERCLLYTSDAADERSSVDLGGRRIIKKKKTDTLSSVRLLQTNKYKQIQ